MAPEEVLKQAAHEMTFLDEASEEESGHARKIFAKLKELAEVFENLDDLTHWKLNPVGVLFFLILVLSYAVQKEKQNNLTNSEKQISLKKTNEAAMYASQNESLRKSAGESAAQSAEREQLQKIAAEKNEKVLQLEV